MYGFIKIITNATYSIKINKYITLINIQLKIINMKASINKELNYFLRTSSTKLSQFQLKRKINKHNSHCKLAKKQLKNSIKTFLIVRRIYLLYEILFQESELKSIKKF